jgi:hypothetical protein
LVCSTTTEARDLRQYQSRSAPGRNRTCDTRFRKPLLSIEVMMAGSSKVWEILGVGDPRCAAMSIVEDVHSDSGKRPFVLVLTQTVKG